jgi:hypothetical protein
MQIAFPDDANDYLLSCTRNIQQDNYVYMYINVVVAKQS